MTRFSGEDFTVDESLGLNGRCDFLISRSPEMLAIEAPAVVIIEAKQADLKTGIGQCVAQMVAAQKFNEAKEKSIPIIYGSVRGDWLAGAEGGLVAYYRLVIRLMTH